jgi:putative membrane protein
MERGSAHKKPARIFSLTGFLAGWFILLLKVYVSSGRPILHISFVLGRRLMQARLSFWGLFLVCLLVVLLTTTAAASKSTEHFIRNASTGNQFEISSSRLALQKSQDQNVKAFAQQMVDDHTQIGNDFKSAIASSNTTLPEPASTLDAKHRKLLDKLRAASTNDFDDKYISEQVNAHDDAVSLFSDYANSSDNLALKNFAAQTLPTLKQHQDHIQQLKASHQS